MWHSLVRKVSLCLAPESYKPSHILDSGPWSQELENKAVFCQSFLHHTLTTQPPPSVPLTTCLVQRRVCKCCAGLFYKTQNPWYMLWHLGWRDIYTASLLPSQTQAGLHVCDESHMRNTPATCSHVAKLLSLSTNPSESSGVSGHLTLDGKGGFFPWNIRNLPLRLPSLGYRKKYFISKNQETSRKEITLF